jgi:hypothetical protein
MKLIIFNIIFFWGINTVYADVHLIIYATQQGRTGHCGIAVDDYIVQVQTYLSGGKTCYRADSIKTGTLLYYDLWPMKDEYKGNYEGDVAPIYYKLPSNHFKQYISLKTLADQGVPHKFGFPCDGILTFPVDQVRDFETIRFLNQLMLRNKDFNALHYNCCDFVIEAINHLTGLNISAKEFIIKNYANTPNQLYKVVSGMSGVRITKDAGPAVNNSFVQARVIDRLMPILAIFQLFIHIPN